MVSVGLGAAIFSAVTYPFPANVLTAVLLLASFGWIIYRATRYDYAWVELDGDTLRGRHLYTGRVQQRRVEEIEDLLTLVFLVRAVRTRVIEAWLGRVRGVLIRFKDKRGSFQITRANPAMNNAEELIQAIAFKMSTRGNIGVELINFEGKPLIRRIHWAQHGLGD